MKRILPIFFLLTGPVIHLPHVCAKDTARNHTTAPVNDSRTSAGVRNTEKNMSNTGKNYTSPNTRIDYSGTSTSGNINDYRSGSSMRNNEVNRSNTGKNYTDPNTRIDYSGTRGNQNRNDPVHTGDPMRNR